MNFWLQAAGRRRYHWAALAAAAAVLFRQTNAVWALCTLAVSLTKNPMAAAEQELCRLPLGLDLHNSTEKEAAAKSAVCCEPECIGAWQLGG